MTSLPQAKRFDWTNLGLRVASGFVLVPTALYATLGQHQHWLPALSGRREALPYLLLISIGAPLLAAIYWGLFISPKATFSLGLAVKLVLEIIVFALAIAALYISGQHLLAIIFAIAAIVSRALLFILPQ